MKTIGFIGAGAMGSALIMAAGKTTDPKNIVIYDHTPAKCQTLVTEVGCRMAQSPQEVAAQADCVILCVQPTRIEPLLQDLMEQFRVRRETQERQLVVSIAAGVNLCDFDRIFQSGGLDMPVVRIMPNIPLRVGKGVLLFAKNGLAKDDEAAELIDLFRAGGMCELTTEENLLAATPVFGCSPAYVYMFIEALADAGSQIGLNRELSVRLAAQATLGSAAMVLESGLHVAQLRDELATPGGMTITGSNVMEQLGFRGALIQGVLAAYRRSFDMA